MTLPARLVLSALYVPATRPAWLMKALGEPAGLVVLDLEDSVHPADKVAARESIAGMLSDIDIGCGRVSVRINALDTRWGKDDLVAMAAVPGLQSVRVPKVSDSDDLAEIDAVLGSAELAVDCLVETASGIEHLARIAAGPRVRSVSLGEADLCSDLLADDHTIVQWARIRLLLACRSAELPPPMMSVFTDLHDESGLRQTCETGRHMGFVGRNAVHPRQLRPIVESFRPTAAEVERALAIRAALQLDAAAVIGGRFVDAAMGGGAAHVLALEAAAAALLRVESRATV